MAWATSHETREKLIDPLSLQSDDESSSSMLAILVIAAVTASNGDWER